LSQLATLFLHHLNEFLTRALPALAMIRQDNMRRVFSAALGYSANSIIVFQQDNSSTESYKQQNSSSFYSALKHVLSEWLPAREPRVCLASSEAIGYI